MNISETDAQGREICKETVWPARKLGRTIHVTKRARTRSTLSTEEMRVLSEYMSAH